MTTFKNAVRQGGSRPNENGRRGGEPWTAAKKPNTDNANFSTSTWAQRQRLLELLRESPRTTADLRGMGIMHPGGRVMELREAGYDIDTRREWLDNPPYRHRRVARYVLIREAGHALPALLFCVAAFAFGALLAVGGGI